MTLAPWRLTAVVLSLLTRQGAGQAVTYSFDGNLFSIELPPGYRLRGETTPMPASKSFVFETDPRSDGTRGRVLVTLIDLTRIVSTERPTLDQLTQSMEDALRSSTSQWNGAETAVEVAGVPARRIGWSGAESRTPVLVRGVMIVGIRGTLAFVLHTRDAEPFAATTVLTAEQALMTFSIGRLAQAQDAETTFVSATDYSPPALRKCPTVADPGRHGTVLVEAIVDSLGRPDPTTARIIQSSDDSLSALALRVAPDCQFTPARLKGHAISVLERFPINFGDSQTRQDTNALTAGGDARPVVQHCPTVTGANRHVTVVVETIVDTLGHPEPGATKIATSPDDSLSTVALRLMLDCQFTPGRHKGQAVRTLVRLPFNF